MRFFQQPNRRIASFMGLIMVVGIVSKMAFSLNATAKLRAAGIPLKEATIQAGRRRLRFILMTALAAFAGMRPLALALGVSNGVTPCDCSDRRHHDFLGFAANHYPRCPLVHYYLSTSQIAQISDMTYPKRPD
jgi:AcrB/AcrD/AcrF family